MARVSGEILIKRLVEQVFDDVADQRNEPICNPRMTQSGKITEGADQGRHAIPRDGKVGEWWRCYRGYRVRQGQELRLTDRNALRRCQWRLDLRAD